MRRAGQFAARRSRFELCPSRQKCRRSLLLTILLFNLLLLPLPRPRPLRLGPSAPASLAATTGGACWLKLEALAGTNNNNRRRGRRIVKHGTAPHRTTPQRGAARRAAVLLASQTRNPRSRCSNDNSNNNCNWQLQLFASPIGESSGKFTAVAAAAHIAIDGAGKLQQRRSHRQRNTLCTALRRRRRNFARTLGLRELRSRSGGRKASRLCQCHRQCCEPATLERLQWSHSRLLARTRATHWSFDNWPLAKTLQYFSQDGR